MQYMPGRSSAVPVPDISPAAHQYRTGTGLTNSPQSSRQKRRPGREATYLAGLCLTFLLLSFNLRPSITGLPPLFNDLTRHLGFSGPELTVLATVPVLSFAVASLALPLVYWRFSGRKLLVIALVVLSIGLVLRGLLPGWLVFFTAVSALAVGFIGAMIPGLIKQYKPAWSGPLLAAYLVGLYGGAMAGGAASVPIYHWSHGSMLPTLSIWALTALLALPFCLRRLRPARAGRASARTSTKTLIRNRTAWFVIAFMALQSLIYYATLSWLPTLLQARGQSAESSGFVASTLNIGGLVAALVIPVLAARFAGQKLLVCAVVLATITGLSGLAFFPVSTAVGWSIVLGAGQGGAIGLALYFAIARTTTPAGAASLSSLSQGIGYLIAATGPPLMDLWHSLTGSWPASFALLTAVSVLELAVGLHAAAPKRIPA
jgi:MFS transporter, CP family, cyanate transporter